MFFLSSTDLPILSNQQTAPVGKELISFLRE